MSFYPKDVKFAFKLTGIQSKLKIWHIKFVFQSILIEFRWIEWINSSISIQKTLIRFKKWKNSHGNWLEIIKKVRINHKNWRFYTWNLFFKRLTLNSHELNESIESISIQKTKIHLKIEEFSLKFHWKVGTDPKYWRYNKINLLFMRIHIKWTNKQNYFHSKLVN